MLNTQNSANLSIFELAGTMKYTANSKPAMFTEFSSLIAPSSVNVRGTYAHENICIADAMQNGFSLRRSWRR